jgi:hypothetical protein
VDALRVVSGAARRCPAHAVPNQRLHPGCTVRPGRLLEPGMAKDFLPPLGRHRPSTSMLERQSKPLPRVSHRARRTERENWHHFFLRSPMGNQAKRTPAMADALDRRNRRKDHPVPWESVEFSAHGPFHMRVPLNATHNVMTRFCFGRS